MIIMTKRSKMRVFWNNPFIYFMAAIGMSIVVLDLLRQRSRTIMMVFGIIIAMVTLLFIMFCAAVTLREMIRKTKYKRISMISDPDKRIPALEKHIIETTGPDQQYYDPSYDYTALRRTKMQMKATLYFSLAIAYIEKGDYGGALSASEKALAIKPVLDDICPDGEMTYREDCAFLMTSCLMRLGRFDEAKAAMAPLMNRTFDNPTTKKMVDSYLLADAINSGDATEARRLLNQVAPVIAKDDQCASGYGIRYEFMLLEAMIDRLENRLEDARDTLEEILLYCQSQGVKQQALQLWEEMFATPEA